MSHELPKTYNPSAIEERWAEYWVRERLFDVVTPADGTKNSADQFTILLPPPNVTGRLHMGHMLNQTEMDILTRWHRMLGDLALWLPGTDHAGIATQMMVERQLKEEGLTRKQMGREAFTERVWCWRKLYGGAILDQMKRLGASVDWQREYFTMDDRLSVAVKEAFIRLYEQGLIYRGAYIVNWDPSIQTAVSDLEVEHEERLGKLYHIKYPLADGSGSITVATTRPETMLGDTAVAVNPADERYTALIGKKVRVPLTGVSAAAGLPAGPDREVTILADDWAKPEFGTGAVKVTPAHDPNDFAIGQRHNLPSPSILDESAHIALTGSPYDGLDRYEARARILADLEARGLLAAVKDHTNSVGLSQRTGVVIEPRLSLQWFLAVNKAPNTGGNSIAKNAIDAVESTHGEKPAIHFTPEMYKKIYLEWMTNLHDWCISRQLWWGHRIPAWHCKSCSAITVSRDTPTHCGTCNSTDITQETDVLDTWFSSGLLPFTTLGWPAVSSSDQKNNLSFRPERSGVEKPASLPHSPNPVISTEGGAFAAAAEKPASLPDSLRSVISTGGGASAAAAEKPASLPDSLRSVISTGGGASAAAAEKPASLPDSLRSVISTGGGASAAAAEKPASLPDSLRSVISTGGGASAAAAEKPASLQPALTPNLAAFYPTSLLVTGFDILFFWVARMIMLGCHFMQDVPMPDGGRRRLADTVPFKEVYIHGLVRDADRQKMSKTKGNVINPIDIIERFGTDAVRFTLASMASPGTDIAFSEARTEGNRAFANKIWNAARFLFMQIENAKQAGYTINPPDLQQKLGFVISTGGGASAAAVKKPASLPPYRSPGAPHLDSEMWVESPQIPLETRWIYTRLSTVSGEVARALTDYRFDEAANAVYQFFWGEFCDWYLELVKLRLDFNEGHRKNDTTRITLDSLVSVFESALRLLSPFMPFITEEIWHALYDNATPAKSIALTRYPQPADFPADPVAEAAMKTLQDLIVTVRALRKELGVPEKETAPIQLHASNRVLALADANQDMLARMARVQAVEFASEPLTGSNARSTSEFDVAIVYERQIDVAAERERLTKDLAKLEKGLAAAERQLGNEAFMAKAPAHIVDGLRKQSAETKMLHEKATAALEALPK